MSAAIQPKAKLKSLDSFSQLQIEVHATFSNFADWYEWFEELEDAGLRIFHRELNYPSVLWSGTPKVMEFSTRLVPVLHANRC